MTAAKHPVGDIIRANATYVGEGAIQARLYAFDYSEGGKTGRYPGAVPTKTDEDRVFGEVWDIISPDAVYPATDHYERCSQDWPTPHEYVFQELPVQLTDGMSIKAGAYLYTFDTTCGEWLSSGRFLDCPAEAG